MRIGALPSVDTLNALLSYTAETGELRWKHRGPEWFTGGKQTAAHNAAIWNGKNAGKLIRAPLRNGHLTVGLLGATALAHRVAWKMTTGEDPGNVIDHIDGNPANNRISNLRVVSQTINSRNAKLSKNSKTGVNGVTFHERTGRWHARIMVSRKGIFLGSFATLEEAVAARRKADAEHGFHATHGRLRAALI